MVALILALIGIILCQHKSNGCINIGTDWHYIMSTQIEWLHYVYGFSASTVRIPIPKQENTGGEM